VVAQLIERQTCDEEIEGLTSSRAPPLHGNREQVIHTSVVNCINWLWPSGIDTLWLGNYLQLGGKSWQLTAWLLVL